MRASREPKLSTEKSPSDKPARQPSRNADYRWAKFDSEAYFQHYYGEPHPDDDRVISLAVAAMKSAPPLGGELDVVDVGTGPNLFPLFCTLPRARRLTAWEYAESNVAWLEAELKRQDTRPQWRHFWQVAREAYAPDFTLPEDPIPLLREKCTIARGSVFDLPERQWQAATMFFCAESITEQQDEFEAACRAYARCVKRGGVLAAAFLARSSGYAVKEARYPALSLSAEKILNVFAPHADSLDAELVGIVPREIRSGYTGLVFMTGRAR
jgi:NNMT/PNMT/TEMT family